MIKWAVVFGLAFVAVVKGVTLPVDVLKSIRESLDDCYEDDDKKMKVKNGDDQFEALVTNDPDPPRTTKCMRRCVLKTYKVLNDDGTRNLPEIYEFLKMAYPDIVGDNDQEAIEKSVTTCTHDVATTDKDEDRCEKVHDSSMCIISNLSDNGIDLRKP